MANPVAAIYPARAVTDADTFVATDRAQTVLAAAINSLVTNIPLNSAANFVTPCLISIGTEIISCPNDAVADTLSGVTRGAFGTIAAAHAIGAAVTGFFGAQHFNRLAAEIKAIETHLVAYPATAAYADNEVPAGAIDGVNAAFTLAHAPAPGASLLLFRNGQLQQQGAAKDYTLAGNTITAISIPGAGDTLQAYYRY